MNVTFAQVGSCIQRKSSGYVVYDKDVLRMKMPVDAELNDAGTCTSKASLLFFLICFKVYFKQKSMPYAISECVQACLPSGRSS